MNTYPTRIDAALAALDAELARIAEFDRQLDERLSREATARVLARRATQERTERFDRAFAIFAVTMTLAAITLAVVGLQLAA